MENQSPDKIGKVNLILTGANEGQENTYFETGLTPDFSLKKLKLGEQRKSIVNGRWLGNSS